MKAYYTVKGTKKDGESVVVYGGTGLEYLYQAFDVMRKEWESGEFCSLVIVKKAIRQEDGGELLETYELREV